MSLKNRIPDSTTIMSRPINVLFLIPSLGLGGAEAQTIDLVNCLDKERFKVHLVSFEKNLDRLVSLSRNHVAYQHVPRRFKFDPVLVHGIASFVKENRIEVIHCTLQIAMLVGWAAARLSGASPRLVGAVHTTIARNRKDDAWERVLYRHVMQACESIIFVCDEQRSYWRKKYDYRGENAIVIHNGVDSRRFDPSRRDWTGDIRRQCKIPDDAPVACCIARFGTEKGQRVLIEAMKKVIKAVPESHLLLAGDGGERPAVEQLVSNLASLNGRVHFLGALSDVRPVLDESHVLVIPSTAETFSMAMLEAMSMERPVVATDVGGAREAVLQDVTGLLVKPGDVDSLAAAVVLMLRDLERTGTMGKVAREAVLARFSREKMVRETEELLYSLACQSSADRGHVS